MATAIAYLRVSTDEQAESKAGLFGQEDACNRWATAQGLTVESVHADEGISGSTGLDKRPALLNAISALSKGDVLIVAKRDRLGRDPIAVAMIEAAIARRGARVVSTAGEGTDNDDPTSILMRRMVDAFAEYERLLIGARTKAAMQAMKARGERVGHVPFGFHLAPDGLHVEEDEVEQRIIARVQTLHADGMTWRAIADEMNRTEELNRGATWNHVSLQRCCKAA